MNRIKMIIILFLVSGIGGCTNSNNDQQKLRIGYLPNLTHVHALLGEGLKWYEVRIDRSIQWHRFNAGPSIMEALFAGHLDLAYIGPGPALLGYLRSKGDAIRVISGATAGGAALVVHPHAQIKNISDLDSKKLASPQIGNTQDIALRHFLKDQGFVLREHGGNVSVLPIRNTDQFIYFQQGQIDGVWTVEPWVSRLELEAQGKILMLESSLWPEGLYPTTLLIIRKEFLENNSDLVKKWLNAQYELTQWILSHPDKTKETLINEIYRHTGIRFSKELMDRAYNRIQVSDDPMKGALLTYADWLYETGLVYGPKINFEGILYYDD